MSGKANEAPVATRKHLLSPAELARLYEAFASRSAKLKMRPETVPIPLRPLIHYAEFWGASDDGTRQAMVDAAPEEVKENLVAVVSEFDDEFDEWLAAPDADSLTPSPEYIAFSAMRMAADLV